MNQDNRLHEVPEEITEAFGNFCKERGWTPAEVLCLAMLEAMKIGDDHVIAVLRQRERRRQSLDWFRSLNYFPKKEH